MHVAKTDSLNRGAMAVAWLHGLLPRQVPLRSLERFVACLGAFLGIAGTAIVTELSLGSNASVPLIIAPMGASAVLVFAVPASPLAQPWAVLVGNTLSAFVGIAAAALIPDLAIASAVAVSGAIGVMALARCVHPPGGAVALTAVVGGPVVTAAGISFALAPVLLNSVILTVVGLIFNNATRRQYPHVPLPTQDHATRDPAPQTRAGFTIADIDAALARFGETLDVSREDLDALFRDVALEAHRRRHGGVTCAMIMSRDVVTVTRDTAVAAARALLVEHSLRMLPVVDSRRVLGILHASDLGDSVVSSMRTTFARAEVSSPIGDLLDVLTRGVHHEVLIVDGDDTLLGVVTQTDILAALYRARVVDAAASP